MRAEVAAIRSSVALSELSHVAYLRVSGEDAFALVDRFCPAEILLRDGQLLHSLLLDDDAHPIGDLYLGRDDESFLLAVDGMSADAVSSLFRDERARVEIERFDESHAALGLNGPYAWELLGELIGPEVIGLPFANLFHFDRWLCFRAGKTGEYGYELLIPHAEVSSVRARLEELGRRFDLAHARLDALDHCALENWFFNIRREGRAGVTPLELQLQWRVSYKKDYRGAAALQRRRAEGIRRRLTYLAGAQPGAAITRDGIAIGEVVNSGFCEPRNEHVALALLDRAWAHSGLDGFDGLRTISPPAFGNRSLFVNPQRHSYFTRHESEAQQMVLA